jgi:hypothetical protein
VGTDVYDKILVLQALSGQFPRAVFFTTDLDARLLDSQHISWTRHLLIGSAFGLGLRQELQADIPPFRDTYQTSAYLATVLAIERAARPIAAPSAAAAVEPASPWTGKPRIFEIGNSTAFDLTAKAERAGSDDCTRPQDCVDIFPLAPPTLWKMDSFLTGFFIASIVTALLLAASWVARGTVLGRVGIYVGVATLLVFCAIGSEWPPLAHFVYNGHSGLGSVPILGGVSLCPAWIAESLAIVAAVTLVFRGTRMLDANAVQLSDELRLPTGPRDLARDRGAKPTQIETVLARYLSRGRGGKRVLRVALATMLWTFILFRIDKTVDTHFIEVADLPAGDTYISQISAWTSFLSCFAIQFLVFWVVDAMVLSADFTCALERVRGASAWPDKARAAGERQLGLPSEPAVVWLNLKLVAARTECVAGMVWYPSIVLAAMAVANFTVEFGQFHFASNPVSLTLSAVVVLAAAAWLRKSAETLRNGTLSWLEGARGCVGAGHQAGAMEALDRLIARVRGLDEGALAPYSQQPLVKALIVPAASYAGGLILQYFHLPGG